MIRAIFCDIGGVLIDFDAQAMMKGLAKQLCITEDRLQHILVTQQLVERFEMGTISLMELLVTIAPNQIELKGLPVIERELCQYFSLNEQVESLIQKLHTQTPLYLLSNTNPIHYEYLVNRFPIFKYFTGKVLSYEHGVMKPDPKIYQIALGVAQLPAEQCLYIDDRKELIISAQRLGLQCHHFHSARDLQTHIEQLRLLL